MTQKLGGLLFSDAGQLQALDGSAGVPVGSSKIGGWAVKSTGEPYVHNLGSFPPAETPVYLGGCAFHQDGRRYVTTDAPSSPRYIGGFAVRTLDGALYVSTSAVTGTDRFLGGWATANGVARTVIN